MERDWWDGKGLVGSADTVTAIPSGAYSMA